MDAAAIHAVLDALESLPPVGRWVAEAACRGQGDLYSSYPATTAAAELVRVTCLACPVLAACERYSREHDVEGIWSGRWHSPVSGGARDFLEPPEPRRSSQVVCGTLAGYRRHKRQREEACGPCKAANSAAARELKARRAAA